MAEQQMEAAQSARRIAEFDPLSDDEIKIDSVNPFATSLSDPSSSMRQTNFTKEPIQSHDPSASTTHSLLDDSTFDNRAVPTVNLRTRRSPTQPGLATYLEMEEEPQRGDHDNQLGTPQNFVDNEPIRTSSGLLLTHRRTPTSTTPRTRNSFRTHDSDNKKYNMQPHFFRVPDAFRPAAQPRDFFEVENSGWASRGYPSGGHSPVLLQVRRLMSYVHFWVVISFLLLLVATGVLMHSFGHVENNNVEEVYGVVMDNQASNNHLSTATNVDPLPEQVILVPMENISELVDKQQLLVQPPPPLQLGGHHNNQATTSHEHHRTRRVLLELRQEFEEWILHHGKTYHSDNEKEHRFRIWTDNHQRTKEKNRRHGPCKMTQKNVFGSNQFKDLSPEEFKSKYLTGYTGPRPVKLEEHPKELGGRMRTLSQDSRKHLDPNLHKIKVHHSVKQRMLQQEPVKTSSYASCSWYDISCWLRWICGELGITFGSNIMEPEYDAGSYPKSVDWRELGAVTDIRTQGDCGACWAITAVETVESAHYISTGNLYELSESEIIACDDSCEMCSGGWPQNAFEWVMEYGGLPLSSTFAYDGSTLLSLTEALEGTSDTYTEDDVDAYRYEVCPASGGSSHSGSGSGDYYDDGKENENYGDYSDQGRYGNIKGYGYATDRCVCYSDGSGCDCDGQNEGLAVRNLATYGPAVVCIDASLWQDYDGGIMTTDIGCSSAFLDMNHCVQAVGYAFSDGDNYDAGEEEDDDGDGSGSSKSSGSGSQDSAREGYWIIRNQWGYNWGMSGYAYVAMGENTCGVLNDMTQAYL